ncbi:MAG: hypothetical protein ACLFRI_01710 [Candidatus Izemoplasmataceae bacterium]
MTKIIALKPKGKQFYTLTLEDETLVIHQETVIDFELFTKKELDKKMITQIKKSDEIAQAKSYALKKLSYKFYTPKRLKDALSMVNYTQEVIHKAIEDLKALGYINEEKTFKLVIDDFIEFELKGKHALIDKLYKEGFNDAYIRKVDALFSSELETSKGKAYVDQIQNQLPGQSHLKKKLSLKQKLYQRGFTASVIESCIEYYEKMYLDFDEDEALMTLIENNKRYNLDDFKDKNRFMQKLLRDGFKYDAIKKYLK